MDLATCAQCAHFRLHYVLSTGTYMPLNYGHCVARRHKKLLADSKCCEHFLEKETENEPSPPPKRYVVRIEIERL